jgi:hypothetical protein
MLEAVVGVVVGLLIVAGILVMLGPNVTSALRRLRSAVRPVRLPSAFQATKSRDVVPPALNPKTQRVIVAAARLSSWLRAHAQEEVAREIRTAAARMTANEPAGLYALQNALRRIRVVNIHDRVAQERLKALVKELHTAVQDRFEQLELLPFRKP